MSLLIHPGGIYKHVFIHLINTCHSSIPSVELPSAAFNGLLSSQFFISLSLSLSTSPHLKTLASSPRLHSSLLLISIPFLFSAVFERFCFDRVRNWSSLTSDVARTSCTRVHLPRITGWLSIVFLLSTHPIVWEYSEWLAVSDIGENWVVVSARFERFRFEEKFGQEFCDCWSSFSV